MLRYPRDSVGWCRGSATSGWDPHADPFLVDTVEGCAQKIAALLGDAATHEAAARMP